MRFETQAGTLGDEVVACALAIGRIQYIIYTGLILAIDILQRLLFVLAEAVGCLDEVVVADRLHPRQVESVVETIVLVARLLVDQLVAQGTRLIEILQFRAVLSVALRVAVAARDRGTEHTSLAVELTAEL